jgi:hypothetical protein
LSGESLEKRKRVVDQVLDADPEHISELGPNLHPTFALAGLELS